MPSSRLTKKGQATIPLEVRELLSLKPGDRIEFMVLDNGIVVIQPSYIDVMDLTTVLHKPRGRKRLSIPEMNNIIKERARGRHAGRG